jgi:raffinose/stachyose/melibiose transport system permease protein
MKYARLTLTRSLRQLPTHIILAPLVFLWVYPFLWMLSSGFKTQSEMFLGGLNLWPQTWTLDNYGRAWEGANFAGYSLNTAIVSVSSVAIVVLISSLAGFALSHDQLPGRRVILGVLVATMFLPKGFSILPVFVLINSLGLNNTLGGIILAEAGPAHVIAVLLFMGFFTSIPSDITEAAIIDGASKLRIYWQIMLPLATPVVATVAIFNFIATWNAFLVPLVFTLANPALRTLGVGMYAFFGEYSTDWTGLAAGSVMAVLPIIVVFLLLQRYFIQGLAGAVRG